MEQMALEQNISIQASREKIWQAITDPDQVIQWLVPNLSAFAQMTCDESGKYVVHMGPVSVDFVLADVLDKPQKVSLSSLPDKLLKTSYMLNEEDDSTDVSVTMDGFETLIEASQQDRLKLSNEGWQKALQNLKAFMDGIDLPFPQAFVGPLFGYWRESKNTLAVERSIWIDAPRQKVWHAITDPAQIQLWFSPATAWQLSALELGGRLYVLDEESKKEMYVEVIELLEPLHQLTTRCIPEAPSTVVKGKTYTLTEEKGGTRLTVTYSGYEQEPEESRWSNMEENGFGFGMMLQNTKAYVEGTDLPFPGGF